MVMQYIRNAWKAYKNNLMTVVGAQLLIMLLSGIFVLIAAFPFFSLMVSGMSLENAIQTMLTMPAYFIFSATLFMIGITMSILLQAGIIKVYQEALKKISSIETMFETAKAKMFTVFIAEAIIMFIALLSAFVLFMPTVIFETTVWSILLLPVSLFLFTIVMIFFTFTPYAIVLDNKKAAEAIVASINFTKKNFFDVLALMILVMIVSILVGFVPFLGTILNIFLIGPIFAIAYVSLYTAKRAKRK